MVLQRLSRDEFEVIVVDDGSADNTREIVTTFAEHLNLKYLYQQDRGYRPASARNLGIAGAEGEICVLIDSAVLLKDDCLQHHINFHKQHEHSTAIGYVYGFEEGQKHINQLHVLIDPSAPSKSILEVSQFERFQDVRMPQYKKYNCQIENLPAPWLYFWTCHVSIKRSDLLKVQLFDANYDGRWGVEDNDLGFRLLANGCRIRLLLSAEAIHYPHEKNKLERHLQGYLICCYFHNKFVTFETQVFLDHYMDESFFDVNDYVLLNFPEKNLTNIRYSKAENR